MKETRIYVGLNDSKQSKQLYNTGDYISALGSICGCYRTSFSFSIIQGGYYSVPGELTTENTLLLTLIDVEDKIVDEIAKDLCVFFHQDSVLITTSNVESRVIKEKL